MSHRAALLATLLALLPAAPALAAPRPQGGGERSFRLGLQASYADDAEFGVGARALWRLPVEAPLDLIGSFDYFFPPETEGAVTVEAGYWEANGNLAYRLGRRRFRPYLGAGLNVARSRARLTFLGRETGAASDTALGANVLAGLRRVRASGFDLFVEARFEIKGGEQFVATVGLLF